MRIVINDIAASSGGALSIIKDFYESVCKKDEEHEWIFLLNNNFLEEASNIKIINLWKVKSKWINRLKFDFITGSRFIMSLKPDIVISFQNTITFGLKVPQIVYVHQAIPFQSEKNFSFLKAGEWKMAIYQYIIGWIIKKSIIKADKVIVQTKWMKSAVIEKTGIKNSKIIDIMPSLSDVFKYKRSNILKKNIFFYPASNEVYKNHGCIYKACNLLNKEGIYDFKVEVTIDKYIENPSDNIVYLGKITREQVLENYNKSILIFPSYIETLGLPLLEAREMGTIILASACEFSRELLDDYENAYFFNPYKPEQLVVLMKKVLDGIIVKKEINDIHEKVENGWLKIKDVILKDIMKKSYMKKVLFLANIPSPYRVEFFNALGKQCDLTVLYERTTAKDRDEKWKANRAFRFIEIFLKGIKIGNDSALCLAVIKYLNKKKYDIVIVGGYSTPTGMIAIEYLKFRKIPFILNVDGGLIKTDKIIKHILKKHFISSAKSWLSTGSTTTEYLIHYGAKGEKIYVYPFTSLKENELLKKPLSEEEKMKIKEELKIKDEKVILSVGSFIYRKGFDILLKACSDIERNIGIYIVGGEPTKEYKAIKDRNNLANVHFVGFKTKEELVNYYKVADVFVLPTREDIWGLVINEAMAQGLPIITTNRCGAGLELVENGENGFVIDTDNEKQLKEKINEIINNNKLCEQMGKSSLRKIQSYTIENMARQHIDYINSFIEKV